MVSVGAPRSLPLLTYFAKTIRVSGTVVTIDMIPRRRERYEAVSRHLQAIEG